MFPGFAFAEHGVEHGQQLAQTGDQCDLLAFAGGQEVLVMTADHRVVACGDERGHVERGADGGAAAGDGADATPLPAVAVERCDADQRGDLLPRAAAQLRQVDDQLPRRLATDPRNTFEQILFLAPRRRLADQPVQVVVDRVQLLLQQRDDLLDAGTHGVAVRLLEAVALGGDHLHQLRASRHVLLQNPGVFVGQIADRRLDHPRETRQHGRVDAVGLGEPAGGPGEVADLAWVDHRDGQRGGEQRRDERALVSAGGFEHDQLDRHALQRPDHRRVSRRIVGEACRHARVPRSPRHPRLGGQVQVLLADVDPDANVGHECDPSLRMRACVTQRPWRLYGLNSKDRPGSRSPTACDGPRAIDLATSPGPAAFATLTQPGRT